MNAVSKNHVDAAKPVVYFTPNRAYALFYIRDREINWVTCGVKEDGVIRYDERFPDQLKTIYQGVSGYVYFRTNSLRTNPQCLKKWREPLKVHAVILYKLFFHLHLT